MTQAITSAPAPILSVPPEIFQGGIIAKSEVLDFSDICRLQKVCRSFHECAQQDFIWKPYLMRDYPLQECQENVQQAYRRSHLLRSNVINGVFKEVRLGKHGLIFGPSLSVAKDKIIAGGFGEAIKIRDLKTKESYLLPFEQNPEIFAQLDDPYHQQNVRAFAAGDDQILFLGFRDGKIQVYDLKIKKCLLSFSLRAGLFAHNPLFSLAYSKEKLFAGLTDGTIKVLGWSAEKNELKEIEELDALNSLVIKGLAVSGNTLVSIDTSGTVQFWDLTTYECRHTFHYPNFTSYALSDQRFIIAVENGDIDILSIEDGTVLHSLAADIKVESLVAIEGIFFSEGRHEREFWDLATGKRICEMPRPVKHEVHYTYSEGTLFDIAPFQEIGGANYLADDDEIFADIAQLFRTPLTESEFNNVMERFNHMPKYAREQIALKFPPVHLTREIMAEAIEAYLAERREKEEKK